MPKLKTHKATSKRIKITSSGKLLRRHAFSNHFLQKKGAARKRNYRKDQTVDNQKPIKKLLGR